MAEFTPKKIELNKINNGNRFRSGDSVSPDAINAPIEAAAYAQNLSMQAFDFAKDVRSDINYNSKRIENLEASLSDDAFISDSSVAYQKSVPVGVAPYAAIEKIGGMTYKDGNTLKHAKAKAIESKGINIWDEQWEFGSYGSNGEPIEQSGIRSKSNDYILVEPSTDYYIYNGTSAWVVLHYYDASKQHVGFAEVQSGIRTTPSNAKYIRFRLSSDYGTTYNNDVSIYKSDATMNGKYYPYVGTIDTFTIPEAVQNCDGYGVGTLDGNNHIYYANNVKVYYSKPIKIYEFTGDEDLGEYGSTNEFFRCVSSAVDDALQRQTNALCSHLPIGDFANSFSIDSGSTRFSFRFAYDFFVAGETTTAERIETIRRWLKEQKAQGTPVTIVYALQTPPADEDITDLMPIDNYIKVEGGGTIIADNVYEYAVPTTITYQKRG